MSNHELAQIFESIADIQEILQEDQFRVNANRRVADIISGTAEDISLLNEYGQLANISGLGSSSIAKIQEYCQTGSIGEYQQLLSRIPQGLLPMLKIQGLGPKTVGKIWRELKIDNLSELLLAARDGRLAKLSGFGKASSANIAANIEFRLETESRIPLGRAIAMVETIRSLIQESSLAIRLYPVGSLRRCCETVGDIDLLVVTDNSRGLLDYVSTMPGVSDFVAGSENRASFNWKSENIRRKPCPVEVFCVSPENEFASFCFLTPGSEQRQLLCEYAEKKRLTINEKGLFKAEKSVKCTSEAMVYKKLGLPYILPTLQDDTSAQKLAISKKLPVVVQIADIRGDLHMHTPYSDGRSELHELVAAAISRGYEYIAITDHSRSSVIANGLATEKLLQQISEIKQLNSQTKQLEILAGCEVDILSDGSLDYGDDILAQLDYVAASIHNGMDGSKEKNTTRIMKAMDNPYIKCICHPTGRYIRYRRPMDLDMEQIFRHAVETETALEVSSQPFRLDLSVDNIRQALDMGVKLIINTDSHDAVSLSLMALGVANAQKALATTKDIVNCLPWKKFGSWLNNR